MKNLLITGIAGAIIFTILIGLYPEATLSPGKLSQGHQELTPQCFSCHQAFGGIKNDKCIACHVLADIGKDTLGLLNSDLIPDDQVLFHKELDQYACTTCHTDHAGLNPESAMNGFGHEILPQSVINDCIACHQTPADLLHLQLTNACAKCHSTTTWELKLAFNHDWVQPADRNNCVGCHETPTDAFHGAVKDECVQCHSTGKWLPSTFDHSAYFVLDRDHDAKCATCHLNNNYDTYTCYGCHEHTPANILREHREERITNLANCVSCHRSSDEHEGREGRESKRKKGRDREHDD